MSSSHLTGNPLSPCVEVVDQRQGEAGSGLTAHDAAIVGMRAMNAAMALLLRGGDVRKAAPLLGQRRVEGK